MDIIGYKKTKGKSRSRRRKKRAVGAKKSAVEQKNSSAWAKNRTVGAKKRSVGTKTRVRRRARLLILLLLTVLLAAAFTAAALLHRSSEGGVPFVGVGRVKDAHLTESGQLYSYYDENGGALLRADADHGAGTAMMCEVVVPYAETTKAETASNLSDPLCSPLVRGTIDRVVSVAGSAEDPIYCLESGVKVNDEYLKITENGFQMPDNRLTVNSCRSGANGLELKFDTLWAAPVLVTLSPQNYFTGYEGRPYNVSKFTAEYMDIFFSRTTELVGDLDLSGSDVVKSWTWFPGENGGTLRLYLRRKGAFYGYSYSLDKNGRFVFVIKKDTTEDTTPTVMLDAGHGGSDPGAASVGADYESALTLDLTKRTAALLAADGVSVLLTRSEETDVSLDERIAMARKYDPALFVSIHCDSSDSGDLYGTHTFYYKSYSRPLADAVHSEMAKVYRELYAADAAKAEQADRGVKFYPFAVTRIEECPSVLVECGYLSHAGDYSLLQTEEGRQKLARAIASGIETALCGRSVVGAS